MNCGPNGCKPKRDWALPPDDAPLWRVLLCLPLVLVAYIVECCLLPWIVRKLKG